MKQITQFFLGESPTLILKTIDILLTACKKLHTINRKKQSYYDGNSLLFTN